MQCKQIYFWPIPNSRCATFLWPGDAAERSGHYTFCSGTPSLGCPIQIKSSTIQCNRPTALPTLNNSQFTPNIPPLFFITYCLYRNIKVLLCSFHVNCTNCWSEHNLYLNCWSEHNLYLNCWTEHNLYLNCWTEHNLYPLCSALPSVWPWMGKWKFSIAQGCVKTAVLPVIIWCYVANCDLSTALLCLTPFTYTITQLHISL
jgi:hypothetical protein